MADRPSRAGSKIPDAELVEMHDGKLLHTRTADLFKDRRVVVFALPGAFTPTCSTTHVPGYVSLLHEFKQAGIDDVICLAVNDPYVMDAWQRQEKAEGLRFMSDPFGEFTRAMGMSVDHRDAGLGVRSWRYSMMVENGVIKTMFIERDVPGDPFEVSDAETMIKHLRPDYRAQSPVFMLARHGCPHCARAKEMLTKRSIPFEVVHLGEELTMRGVKAASGVATVPQIFMEGKLIGGADQLAQYLA